MTKKPSPQIVAAGIIEKDGCILIGKRKQPFLPLTKEKGLPFAGSRCPQK
jgi:hypothetical protein